LGISFQWKKGNPAFIRSKSHKRGIVRAFAKIGLVLYFLYDREIKISQEEFFRRVEDVIHKLERSFILRISV